MERRPGPVGMLRKSVDQSYLLNKTESQLCRVYCCLFDSEIILFTCCKTSIQISNREVIPKPKLKQDYDDGKIFYGNPNKPLT